MPGNINIVNASTNHLYKISNKNTSSPSHINPYESPRTPSKTVMFSRSTFYSRVKEINSDLANEFRGIDCPVTISMYDSPELAKAKAYIWLTRYLDMCNRHMSVWLSTKVDNKTITSQNASEIIKCIGNVFSDTIYVYNTEGIL